MNFEQLTIDEIRRGYTDDRRCILCNKKFNEGQIYPVDESLYDADTAIQKHIETEHADHVTDLIDLKSKYNTLTEKQRQLLKLFSGGSNDSEVAKELGLAASTIRQQRFQFREKAKQAKLYLAIYESVFNGMDSGEEIIPVHATANMLDERFIITEKERKEILDTAFLSLEPLVLSVFPRKEKKKVAILTRISEEFEKGREYSEIEINDILKRIYEDHTTLRRYLIDYGFLERTNNGKKYWVSD